MSAVSPHIQSAMKPFWHPLLAGVLLGLVLLLTFAVSGHGLGASGAATHAVAGAGLAVVPEATRANGYLGPMVAEGSPMGSWITWEVLGIAIGALAAAFMAGRFRVQLDGGKSLGTPQRLTRALLGGLMAGFGARVSAGCTSGLGLSGAATLGIAAFVFLGLFFVTGLVVSRFVKGI
jgi:uncharacterized membrane protein YedE/YeeE